MSIPINMKNTNHQNQKTMDENVNSEKNKYLEQLCFQDFQNNKYFGFGSKRISVNIEGTITQKYPFRAFGYRDENHKFYVGMRRYYDQGDGFKIVEYDSKKTIENHIVTLIQEYEKEEIEKNSKNSLNIQTCY